MRDNQPVQQSLSMAILTRAGLTTPTSWLVQARDLRKLTLDSTQEYYCRVNSGGTKTTLVVLGRDVPNQLSAHSDLDGQWLVQPLLNFSLAGAAYVDSDCSYVELVLGAPAGLLRHGELAYAWFQNAKSWSHASRQELQWKYEGDHLISRPITSQVSEGDKRDFCARIAATIRTSEVTGLFEWGYTDGKIIFLDLKLMATVGVLPEYIRSRLLPQAPPPGPAKTLRSPVLEQAVDVPTATSLNFVRGARLSHAATYRCSKGFTNCYFQAW